ncbi:MAG: FeoA family protein [Rubrivivax sp.]
MSFWSFWTSPKDIAPGLLPRTGAAGRPPRPAAARRGLDAAATGLECRVVAVESPSGQPDWGRWLAEIGFLPGERVAVTARSLWGGDPMVVRVGQSSFALRRAEAACVQVEPV